MAVTTEKNGFPFFPVLTTIFLALKLALYTVGKVCRCIEYVGVKRVCKVCGCIEYVGVKCVGKVSGCIKYVAVKWVGKVCG